MDHIVVFTVWLGLACKKQQINKQCFERFIHGICLSMFASPDRLTVVSATPAIHVSLAQEIRFHQRMSLQSLNTCSRGNQKWRGKEASARIWRSNTDVSRCTPNEDSNLVGLVDNCLFGVPKSVKGILQKMSCQWFTVYERCGTVNNSFYHREFGGD